MLLEDTDKHILVQSRKNRSVMCKSTELEMHILKEILNIYVFFAKNLTKIGIVNCDKYFPNF